MLVPLCIISLLCDSPAIPGDYCCYWSSSAQAPFPVPDSTHQRVPPLASLSSRLSRELVGRRGLHRQTRDDRLVPGLVCGREVLRRSQCAFPQEIFLRPEQGG